ncbi:hypothetical protein DITRI_Ditri04bG0051500 [Diplodiscus trichospermus]
MGEENDVMLLCNWSSPVVKIVQLALKLRVPFEYVEEDLKNKKPLVAQIQSYSQEVLVHKGKPVVESLIIAKYIDETWKNSPQFLPEDPYKRAKVLFWCSFVQQHVKQNSLYF